MRNYKNIIIIVGILLFVIIAIPFGINELVVNNDYYSKATNDGWVSFMGSYLGGIFGGFATLIGVLITLKTTRKQNIKPTIVIDMIEELRPIYGPNYYNDRNSNKEIINFRDLPYLTDIFNIELMNTGKGYAKDIEVTFSIKKNDLLITDNNKMWLFINIPLNEVEENDDEYIQNFRYSYLGSDGEMKNLPLNLIMNSLILASLWNIENSIIFTEEDFLKSLNNYRVKMSNKPLTIPVLDMYLSYKDMDDNLIEVGYKIIFEYIYQQIGSYTAIKPKIKFLENHEMNRFKLRNENKKSESVHERTLSKEEERILILKDFWYDELVNFGLCIGLKGYVAESIARDDTFERVFYIAYNNATLDIGDFICQIAFVYFDSTGELLDINETILDEILSLKIKLFEYLGTMKEQKIHDSLSDEIENKDEYLSKINQIVTNKTALLEYFFRGYEKLDEELVEILVIRDRKDSFKIKINIGDKKLKTELGFYRTGYTYMLVDEDESVIIQSVAKKTTSNSAFGFLDFSGYTIGKTADWHCIYMR